VNIEISEIMTASTHNTDGSLFINLPTLLWHENLPVTTQICSGKRLLFSQESLQGSISNNFTTMSAGPGAQVHDMVRSADGVFIVLDHKDCVT
jgi:hypothetical protein